jgi:branched-chain amino acid transport system substrate-binding protein
LDIPTTGGGFDGPEWATARNMFTTTGDTNGRTSNNTQIANFYKIVGATNIGGLAYAISPSSTGSIEDTKTALQKIGLKMGYENLSVPFGGVDVTGYVLAMRQAGVDGAGCSCVQSTNLALFTGLRQAGLTNVKALSYSSADSSVFSDSTAAAAAQGAYYPSQIPPLDQNNPATNTMIANLKQYDPLYKGGYPSFGATGAYLAAVLMVKGLQEAGQNPTRESFISNMRTVTSWDANGLLASPVGFNMPGTSQPTRCSYYVQVKGNTFVSNTVNGGKPICGTSF